MSEVTRREALGQLAAAFAAAGALDGVSAAEAHALVQQQAGTGAAARALSVQQFRTLERLTDLIIPVDNGKPGALQAQVPAWIDALLGANAELQSRYAKGLTWIDSTMRARHGTEFASSTPEQQTALLDTIAFQKNRSTEMNPGIDFFILARRMTVDGFYTSPIGMRDLYPGNTAQREFKIPKEAMEYVVGRSPFKQ